MAAQLLSVVLLVVDQASALAIACCMRCTALMRNADFLDRLATNAFHAESMTMSDTCLACCSREKRRLLDTNHMLVPESW
ncbi:hypothetical protein OFN60_38700, partial [Escherichia coli]|nr:hypothetical protein [Escherichia coli]